MKKTISIILTLVTLMSVFCWSLSASCATATTLKNGSYVTIIKNGSYKITVPGEGYVITYLKCVGSKSSSSVSADLEFLNAKKKDFTHYDLDNDLWVWQYGKGSKYEKTEKIPVSKGTYYIKISDRSVSDGGSVSVKYVFKSITQASNYSCSKASTLKKNTERSIYQTPANNFDRWFKITLTSNAKVKFSGTKLSTLYVDMYDTEGNDVDIDSSSMQTKSKLAKGTYYICVSTSSRAYGSASFATIKWS